MAKSKGRLLSELAEAPKNEDYSDVNALPNTGNKVGDQAFVEETDRLYIWNGSGWYNIALINTTPTWDSGGQPASSYELSADSPQTATSITLAASDPEGIPISYTYVTGGSMDSIATISQDSSVFTITPKTLSQVPDGGTGSITFRASDGINILPQVSSFTLNFISTIQNSKHTTLLVTAVDTSDNNNITDSSSNNHTPTLINPADALKQGSFSPYRSGGYATYFDGSGDFLEGPAVDLLGSGAFTLECWAYISSSGNVYTGTFLAQYQSNQKFIFGVKSNVVRVWMSGSEVFVGTTNIIGGWHHIALVRDSNNNCQVYIGGNAEGSSFSNSTDFSSSLENFEISSWDNGANSSLDGYISDLRVVKGTAITPPSGGPTERLEAVTNTSLLTCHLPYIADGSTNDHSITVNNDVSIKPFSPYDYLEYSATDHGGNIQSTNSNDSSAGRTGLSFADHADFDLAGSDWTFEWWAYVPESSGVNNLNFMQKGASGAVRPYSFNYRLESGQPGWEPRMFGSSNGSSQWEGYSGSAWQPWSTWTHVAFVRNGSTITRYINGKAYGTGTGDVFDNNEVLYVGGGYGDEQPHTYSDLRISKSAVYTAEFTPPTAPLSSTGSVLHIKGTNASIIDKAQGGNLTLIGDTTGSTTQVKFSNTKSMYFDGSGDYIAIPDNEAYGFGTGDWTIETWLYCTKTGGFNAIFDTRVGTGTETGSFGIGMYNTGRVQLFSGGIFYYPTNSLSFNTWQHFAVVKNSGTTTMYFNGTAASTTYSDSRNYGSSQPVQIGKDDTTSNYFGGYMQDFRITKGLARYTANFTPPTASLEG